MKKAMFLTLALLFIYTVQSHAQVEARSANFWGLSFSYGIDFSAGDLSDRFGQHFHAGMGFDIYKNKSSSLLRLEGAIFFGSNVKEDVLATYRNDSGAILGNDGRYADVFSRQRGSYLGLLYQKMVFSRHNNPHSGLALGAGVGMFQHKIRFQVDSDNLPQVEGDYAKGYDRNSVGPALKQNFSYTHIGLNKNLNYQLSLYVLEGFTQNTRTINFDTKEAEDGRRLDLDIGLEFRWIIPFKDRQPADEIYY